MPPLLVLAFLALGAGVLIAGVVVVYAGDPARSVGLLLACAGLSFPLVFVAEGLVWDLPGWLLVTAQMAFAVALVVAGVVLDAERVGTDGWVPPRASAGTDDASGGGWTNEHVRDGYDVDGSEVRTSRTRMRTHLQFNRMKYELLGPVWRPVRGLDPVFRAFGRVLNREAAVEQAIAEREYVVTTVTATDREGVGSPYWRLAVATLVGVGLVAFGSLWALVTVIGVVRGVGPVVGFAGVACVSGAGGLATLVSVRRTLNRLVEHA